jgi:hypothetical protein
MFLQALGIAGDVARNAVASADVRRRSVTGRGSRVVRGMPPSSIRRFCRMASGAFATAGEGVVGGARRHYTGARISTDRG